MPLNKYQNTSRVKLKTKEYTYHHVFQKERLGATKIDRIITEDTLEHEVK